ncbi:hypothetical protein [Polymorphospora sp. NPDC050346]|uniref:hypothetical protein n=1 Tax=Polymorphospora sp. NPDC050346 TaxID=3155780 RepID=UPI0033F8E0E2
MVRRLTTCERDGSELGRGGAALVGHAGIDTDTEQLAAHADGPRRLLVSSDFYAV